MAEVQRRRNALATVVLVLGIAVSAPALAEKQVQENGTGLYDHPVLAVDLGMHLGDSELAVDRVGHTVVTGGSDKTVRIWSLFDGKLLRTIHVPVGPEEVGKINAVAVSPDGSTVAAGGWTETLAKGQVVYLFDRESGALVRRIPIPYGTVVTLRYSADGRYLAAGTQEGLRLFDRQSHWSEVFHDLYGGQTYGVAFSVDGHLATAAFDGKGTIRLYDLHGTDIHLVRSVKAPSGILPFRTDFSPDGALLAVGYEGADQGVDLLDGWSLQRVSGLNRSDFEHDSHSSAVAWAQEGKTLYVGGSLQGKALKWETASRKQWLAGCGGDTHVATFGNSVVLLSSDTPCLSLIDATGNTVWSNQLANAGPDEASHNLRTSHDGRLVEFRFQRQGPWIEFDLDALKLTSGSEPDQRTQDPVTDGLNVSYWKNSSHTKIDSSILDIGDYNISYSLSIGQRSQVFFLGTHHGLLAFDAAGKRKWSSGSNAAVMGVNASDDGRTVVSHHADGTIHWQRADDGQNLLTLQIIPKVGATGVWNWVLWTPEGFYEATAGAQDALKWVVNHGPESGAAVLPVSAIPKLHRPNTLPHVLDELDTAHALGVDDISQARSDVQIATGSAKPPGSVLHVLAIGVDQFGDKAGDLRLNYAVKDARDIATALLESQKSTPGKASFYANVNLTYLSNDKADGASILDALDAMAQEMARSELGQDVAVIAIASHGEMIDGQFYFIPYGFDVGSQGRSMKSAVSASEFARKVAALAAHGKVLLLLDSCHAGAVGAQTWAKDPDAKLLQDTMDLENVTVLASSERNELSEELPEWRHGALAQAFLDALSGAADARGIVPLWALTDAMDNEVKSLTNGRQHLGMHVNFSGDLFMAQHR